jgi:hypothetical protein
VLLEVTGSERLLKCVKEWSIECERLSRVSKIAKSAKEC